MAPLLCRALGAATLALAALALTAPASLAASLSNAGGTLTYAGGDGDNDVTFSQTAPNEVRVVRDTSDDGDAFATASCTENTAGEDYTCSGVNQVVARGNGGADELDGSGLSEIPITLVGGPGNDDLLGGGAADVLNGDDGDDVLTGGGGNDALSGQRGSDTISGLGGNDGADAGEGDDFVSGGDGDDTLSGEEGDDRFLGDAGSDDISGGRGFDTAYGAPNAPPAPNLVVTLDDTANDILSGAGGEVDNVHADVDAIEAEFPSTSVAARSADDTLVGSARENTVSGGHGNDSVDGNSGNDIVLGGDGDDLLRGRDGFADFLSCGAGNDRAEVDTVDRVAECEVVEVVNAGNVLDVPEDLPPAVALDQPAAGALLPTTRATTMTATATDDRGVAQVLFVDDDRIVCADAIAPYTCDYSPRGEDVGRNTLFVTAIDTAQQTASASRAFRVDRFHPTLTATVTPRRDTRAPFRFRTTGRLRLPAAVPASIGCSEGVVSVQVKSVGKTISTRRAELRRDCSFSSAVRFATRRRFSRNGRLRFELRFAGNELLTRTAALRRSVQTRR